MITRAFCRCNSGHYFTGEHCPFDGWSSSGARELVQAVERLTKQNRAVSLEELRKAGVSAATLARTIVVEFGCNESAFEALAPEECVVNGQAYSLLQLDRNFK
jgi:hypothetical protein